MRHVVRFLSLLTLVIIFTLVLASPVLASNGDEIPSFDEWLKAASGPLVSVIVGLALSWVIEFFPAYNNLVSKWKRLVYFLFCLIVPVGAALLRAGLGYVPLTFDPLIWHALWAGFAAGGAGTVAHARKL